MIVILCFLPPLQEEGEGEGEAEWGTSFSSGRSQAEQRPLLRLEGSNRGLHPQQQQQQQFAPLDFDTALPSYPSDAAFSLAESAGGGGGGAPAAATAGSSISLAPSASEPDLTGVQPSLEAVPGGAAAMRPQPREAAAAATAAAGVPPAAMHLPHLRLGRLSAPSSAASNVAPMSPRGLGRAAPLGAAAGPLGAPAADAAAAPEALGSPRSMHGLVRTSLLPASADRQAVQHVGELLSADEEPSSAGFSGLGSRPAATVSANLALPTAPLGGQRTAASMGPSRLLRHSGSDNSRLGRSSGGRSGQLGLPAALVG